MVKKIKIKNLTMVKLNTTSQEYKEYKKIFGPSHYIFLGEITNMPGHCVICSYDTGKIYSGYHTDNFVVVPENEM